MPKDEAVAAIARAMDQAANLAVLALFATFERQVIERLQTAEDWIVDKGYPSAYAVRLGERFRKKVERWEIEEILNLFKPEVDPTLIDAANDVKQYRDWIAHQNPNNPSPPSTTPELAFAVLSDVIDQIESAHTNPTPRPVQPAAPSASPPAAPPSDAPGIWSLLFASFLAPEQSYLAIEGLI